ncbi:MAG TPA: hypothetical protein ENJ90_09050 [Devosia sp.]|nr:hypothetical protein [Devosia sp.]
MSSTVLAIVAILLTALAAAWVLLPAKRSATRQCRFPAPIEDVWAVYNDPESQPAWRAEIDRVEMHETIYPRSWTEFPRHGPPIILSELEVSAPHQLVLSTRAGGFNGRYVARFERGESGKTIGTFTETATITGFLPRLISALFVRPERIIETYAREATAEIERRKKAA